MAYDIFISYRRKGAGAGVAGELQAKFENLGYKVFLDVDEIGSGQFPEQIKQAISECKDFLLVLSPGTLDRCVDEEDWVRREIVLAQELDKNIIGVGLPGFVMPVEDVLPIPLKSLVARQVFLWTHEYRAASFEKIEENLVSTKLKKKRNRRKLFCLTLSLLALVVAVVLLWPKKTVDIVERVEPQQEATNLHNESQLFDYHAKRAVLLTQNLPDADVFKKDFLKMVSDRILFDQLMEGIAECDSALMLKKAYGNQIVDTFGVEAKREDLLDLRQDYFDAIMADIKMLLDEDGTMFASQDLEMAKVLAMPEESYILDSIGAIIGLN